MKKYYTLGLLIVVILICAHASSLAVTYNMDWYKTLAKPALNPPSYVFGIVWTILYIMMASAFWMILNIRNHNKERKRAIIWFSVQIIFNLLWTPIFFGLNSILFGLIWMLLLLLMVIGTFISFYRLNKTAANLLLPYIAWTCFALYLNSALLYLNN